MHFFKKRVFIGVMIIFFIMVVVLVINNEKDVCLQPDFILAYPYEKYNDGNSGIIVEEVFPSNWNEYIDLSEFETGYINSFNVSDKYLWIVKFSDSKLFQIDKNSKEIKIYDLPELLIDSSRYSRGVLTNDNNYYVVNMTYENERYHYYLYQYDEHTDDFIKIDLSESITTSKNHQGLGKIMEDKEGNLWVFAKYNLYKINLTNGKTTFINIDGETKLFGLSNSTIFYDNKIWFINRPVEEGSVVSYYLMSYDILTNKIESHGSPPGLSIINKLERPYISLFLDNENKIWVSDFGFYSPNESKKGTWYKMTPSNLFVQHYNDYGLYEYNHYHSEPLFIVNDTMWGKGGNRVAKLDLNDGEWCLLSKGIYIRLELDNEGQIWAFADDKIYQVPE